jgi:uncharacterized membrane protein YbhN (UPF0104 family)
MSTVPDPDPLLDAASPGSEPRAPRAGRISIWRVLGTILSLALLVYLIWLQGWESITQVLGSLPAHYFWIALGLTLLSRISVSLRWFSLLHSARVKMSLWQALRLTFMGLFASNFLPTTIGGDLVRMAGALYLHADAGVSAASLVVDRLVGMTGMASLAPFGLAIVLNPADTSSTRVVPRLALLPALARLPGVGWIYRKADTFVRSLLRSSMYWLRHPKSLILALLCTYGHMIFTFLAIWLLLQGMHQPLSFWWIGALWSLNYFITTFLPVSINGLGLQEVSIPYLYSHFGGVPMEAGLALAILMRVLPVLASLPGAIFLPDILRPMPAMRQKAETDPDQEIS